MFFLSKSLGCMRCVALLLALLLGQVAFADDELTTAKQAGLIGEQPNGYLGLVTSTPAADTQALVADINQKRKAQYQAIADKNAIPLSDVETLAGKKAIEKTPGGQFIRLPSGQWEKK